MINNPDIYSSCSLLSNDISIYKSIIIDLVQVEENTGHICFHYVAFKYICLGYVRSDQTFYGWGEADELFSCCFIGQLSKDLNV